MLAVSKAGRRIVSKDRVFLIGSCSRAAAKLRSVSRRTSSTSARAGSAQKSSTDIPSGTKRIAAALLLSSRL